MHALEIWHKNKTVCGIYVDLRSSSSGSLELTCYDVDLWTSWTFPSPDIFLGLRSELPVFVIIIFDFKK